MKNKILILTKTMMFIFTMVFFALVFSACNDDCERCNDIIPPNAYHAVSYLALDGGTIYGEAEQTIRHGQNATAVTAVADDGFEFIRWNDGLITPTRHDTNITARITVVAEFEKIITPPYTYHAVLYIALTGGTIQGYAEQNVRHGQSATAVTAVADYGFKFTGWHDGITAPARHDTNITGRITVVAEFIEIIIPYVYHAVTYLALDGGSIYGLTEQTIRDGQNATTVTAIADTGFVFVNWSDGVSTPTRHDTNVTARITVIAIFDYAVFEVNYLAGYGGEIWGEYFQLVQWGHFSNGVVAVPDTGFIFIGWCDGVEYEIRDDLIEDNFTATAHFERIFYGEGTPYKPFKIFNHQDLMNMRLFPANFFKMQNDIDLIGINHEPIFDTDNSFWGSFDGDGFTIYNMTITGQTNSSLFGIIGGGEIRDLTIDNFDITLPDFANTGINTGGVGALAARMDAGIIDNVTARGSIFRNTSGGGSIGGFIGVVNGGKILNSHVYVDIDVITTAQHALGGFIAIARTPFMIIDNSSASGSITIYGDVFYLGGFIGEVSMQLRTIQGFDNNEYDSLEFNRISISNSFTDIKITTTGAVLTGAGNFVAGFVARLSGIPAHGDRVARIIELNNLGVYGDITSGRSATGFIVQVSHANVQYSYVKGNITANSEAVGFIYVATNVARVFRNFVSGNVKGRAGAVGFISLVIADGTIEESFTSGIVLADFPPPTSIATRGAVVTPFVRIKSTGTIKNSFSTSIVVIKGVLDFVNTGGLVASGSVTIINSYFAGSICLENVILRGNAIMSRGPTQVGLLIANAGNNIVKNSHVLYHNEIGVINLHGFQFPSNLYRILDNVTIHPDIVAMQYLADILNVGLDKPVWTNVVGKTPQLKFMIN